MEVEKAIRELNKKNFNVKSLQYCESLITNAAINGCKVTTIEEGCLGLGKVVINGGDEYYSYVITEFYLNDWSSGHKVRKYASLPKKYSQIN